MQSFEKFIPRSSSRNFLTIFCLCVLAVGAVAQQTPATAPQAGTSQSTAAANSQSSQKQGSKVPDWQTPGLPSGIDPKTLAPKYTTIQEDWSSLDPGLSHLKPQPPVVAETAEFDKFTRQLVQVQWRPGDPIDLYVILPKGVKKPPVVLYLYNYSEDTDRFKNDAWCQRVTNGGVAAVGFVSALSGHRFHDRPMVQWFVSELQEALGSTVHDVKFILDYLATRGDVDMDHVGMFGQGSGGTIAILAAAADSRIKAVDALDPMGDWPDWLAKSSALSDDDPNRAEYTKPDFLKRVAPLDPVKWLPDLKTPKIRIQQVQDWTNPVEVQDKIKAAAPKQAEVYRFDTIALGRREAGGRLFEWIKGQLQAPPEKGGAANASAANGSVSQSASQTARPQ